MHRFIEKNLIFIHFPVRLLRLNQKEVSRLREPKAARLFPLCQVTWFPFVPWKTSWFWLFSLSGMRYNCTLIAKSPVSCRKLLPLGPSPSLHLGGLFCKEHFYCFKWSEETHQAVVRNTCQHNGTVHGEDGQALSPVSWESWGWISALTQPSLGGGGSVRFWSNLFEINANNLMGCASGL